jgi:hypothetical protein
MSQEEVLTASDAGYAGMAARYETLMGEAERKAVRWAWYTDYGLDPRPLHFYLSELRWPPGRPLRRVPKRVASGRVLYALDDAGHPLLARELVRVGQHPVTYYDTFFRDLDDGMEVLLFSYDRHRPIHYERVYQVSGRPAGSATTAVHGRDVRVFHCDSRGRLAEVEHEHGAERDPVGPWSKLLITYNQAGDVHEVWQESPAGRRQRIYPPD